MTNLEEIYNKWLNDLEFREEFKKDPIAALKKQGFDMSEEDVAKIKAAFSKIDKSKDEELDDRINK